MSPKSTGAVFEAHYEGSEQEVEVTLVLDYPTRQFFLTVGDTPTAVIDPVNALILGNFLTSHLGNTGSINVTEQVREIGGPDPNRRLAEGETVADRALTESALYADWLERETAAESTDEPLFQGTAKVELGADGKPTGQFNPEGSPKTPELTYLQEDDLRTIAELGDLRNQLSTQYASYGRFVDTTLEKAWLLLPRNDENRRLRPREEFVDFEIWRAAQPRGGWRELWRRPTYHDYFWDVMDALAWAINDLDPTLSRAPEEASA